MARVMAAHQPNFLPYLGFFDKMKAVDDRGTEPGVFIIRDDCQFAERDWHHRNKIRTNTGDGWMWLYIPVDREMKPIHDIKIRHDKKINGRELWTKFHIRMIRDNYKKTPFFDAFFPGLEEIYSDPGDNLNTFNKRIIKYLADCFKIKAETISFYDLPKDTEGKDASETLANMSKAVKADIYLSGDGGKGYLDMTPFGNIKVEFQNYSHPVYPQRYSGFKPYMSAIDALFSIGRLPNPGETTEAK
ncbi:MAG: WbqC family protein [Candidatus Aenigmarchaeota archaeon]|nr:WbqC family protein [Candidatus Aenigmarchaeota archaeon]